MSEGYKFITWENDPINSRGNLKIYEEKEGYLKGELYYKGYWNSDGKCGLEIERKDDEVRVTLTELQDNHGTSITNMIEDLATMIYHQFLKDIPIEKIRWVEHYLADSLRREGTFDIVTFKEFDGKRFLSPVWKRIKKDGTIKNIVDESEDYFKELESENNHSE